MGREGAEREGQSTFLRLLPPAAFTAAAIRPARIIPSFLFGFSFFLPVSLFYGPLLDIVRTQATSLAKSFFHIITRHFFYGRTRRKGEVGSRDMIEPSDEL